MPQLSCPDRETLTNYLLGKIPGEEVEQLEDHLLECENCSRVAATINDSDDFTRACASDVKLEMDSVALTDAVNRAKRLRSEAETVEVDETIASENPTPSSDEEINFLAPAQQSDELGRLGEYRILELLGVGGMGFVFRAEDPALRRDIALKVMRPSVAASRSAKDRFVREAQATAAIEHDNIVHIYQVSEDRGVPYIAMQFLRGESLQQRLNREERISERDTLRIGREIAMGLTAAHKRGLIHRDIKPDNIWLEADSDRVKIVDFGLVRSAMDDAGLTQTGIVVGTPKYMAPEQAQGQSVDHRCDLFSLGSVLYHMATGIVPFQGNNVTATLLAVTQADPSAVRDANPNVSPGLDDLIRRLLEKDPNKRFASADEVVEAIIAIENNPSSAVVDAGAPVHAVPSSSATTRQHARSEPSSQPAPQTASREVTQIPKVWIGLAAVFLFILLGVVVITFRSDKGTLIIKADENVAVEIERNQVKIRDRETGDTYELAIGQSELNPGEYEIIVTNPDSGLTFSTKTFSIDRRGTTPVEVTLDTASIAATSPDRRAAEWVLSIGGRLELRGVPSSAGFSIRNIQQLPDEPFQVSRVHVAQLSGVTDSGLNNLRGLQKLITLNAWDTAITDQGLANMTDDGRQPPPILGDLQISRTKVTETGLGYFRGSSHLDHLEISGAKVRDLQVLRHFPRISTLNIAFCELSGDELAELKSCPSLNSLQMDAAQVVSGGSEHIVAIEQLGRLTLHDNSFMDVENVETVDIDSSFLGRLENLSRLSVFLATIDGAFWPTVAGLPKLEVLQLGGPGVSSDAINRMESSSSLQILTIQKANNDLSGAAIARAANLHPQLTDLNVNHCNIRDPDAAELTSLTSLQRIDLTGNLRVTRSAIESLHKALPQCTIVSDHGKFTPALPSR